MNDTNTKTTRKRLALGGIGAIALAAAAGAAAQQGPEGLEDARGALERWVETRKVITQERRNWTRQGTARRPPRARAARDRRPQDARRRGAGRHFQEADRKRDELVAAKQKAEGGLGQAGGDGGDARGAHARAARALAGTRFASASSRCQQRLRRRARRRRRPCRSASRTSWASWNELNKFQREVTVTSEVRQLADGTSAEVTVLYIGVSCAFYASADGRAAGLGNSTSTG